MTILFDSRWLGTHGIGRFTDNVMKRLDDYYLEPVNLSVKPTFPLDPFLLSKSLKKSNTDLFFSPGFNAPMSSHIPVISTVHDLIPLKVGAEFNIIKKSIYRMLLENTINKADKIFTGCEFAKFEILSYFNTIKESDIVVVSHGISELFNLEVTKYSPGFPYLLYVGNLKAHKNVTRLIKAFSNQRLSNELQLIIVATPNQEVKTLIKQCKLSDKVIFNQGLSDEQLAQYYAGARAVVIPSLYEGFGLPALEAISCGTPVVASNTTSLPEVVGEAGVLVDPYSEESIAEGLLQVCFNEGLRNQLIDNALIQCKNFSWDKTLKTIKREINNLL